MRLEQEVSRSPSIVCCTFFCYVTCSNYVSYKYVIEWLYICCLNVDAMFYVCMY